MQTEKRNSEPIRLWHREYILALLIVWGQGTTFNILIPILPLYLVGLGAEEWLVGMVVGAYGFTSIALRLFGGRITEQRGYRDVLLVGASLLGVTSIAFGLTNNVALLFGLRVTQGIGLVAFFVAITTMVAQVSPIQRMGEAVAYFTAVSFLAQAVAPPAAVVMANGVGFPITFVAAGVASFWSFALTLAVRKPELRRRDGESSPLINRRALFPGLVFLGFTVTQGPVFAFLPLLAVERNLGNPGLWLGVMGIAGLLARPPVGRLSDIYGRGIIIAPGLVGVSLAMIMVSLSTDFLLFMGSAVVYGVAVAACQVGLLTMSIERASMETRSSAVATFQWFWDIGSSVGAMTLGVVAKSVGLAGLFVLVSVGPILGLAGFLLGSAASRPKPS